MIILTFSHRKNGVRQPAELFATLQHILLYHVPRENAVQQYVVFISRQHFDILRHDSMAIYSCECGTSSSRIDISHRHLQVDIFNTQV